MDSTAVTGCVMIVVALVFITGLTVWSRRTINALDRRGYRTLRETMKDIHGQR